MDSMQGFSSGTGEIVPILAESAPVTGTFKEVARRIPSDPAAEVGTFPLQRKETFFIVYQVDPGFFDHLILSKIIPMTDGKTLRFFLCTGSRQKSLHHPGHSHQREEDTKERGNAEYAPSRK